MWNIEAVATLDYCHTSLYGDGLYYYIFGASLMMFISFSAGLVFGIGLIISGMANPAKVLGFLDLAGNWDPSLILVMCGAIAVGFFAFLWVKSRKTTLLGTEMKLPTASQIDRRLIIGSAMFGIGWGIAGFCPGPALVGLGMGLPKALIFVAAMLAGMALFELLERHRGG
jgi:uncharacterized membrane protein YedE/YeeE